MKLLCLETSTKNFSLAVSDGEEILHSRNVKLKRVLSSSIIPAIDGILSKAKIRLRELDGFAIGLGPGSFTSLRVGLSTVKGLAFATQKPVVGVGSLDVMAMNAKDENGKPICVISDAKRGLVYAALYELKGGTIKRKGGYSLLPLEQLLAQIPGPTIFVGDGIKLFPDAIVRKLPSAIFVDERKWLPQAKNILPLVLERFRKKKFDNIIRLVPIYLYPQDCQIQK